MEPNIAELVINELIKENSILEQTKKDLSHFMKQVEQYLRHVSPIKGRKLHDIKWLKKEFHVTYPIFGQPEPKSTEASLEFWPPENFKIIDFSFNCCFESVPIVELAVEIPDKILAGRDYLNQSYHRKRAIFLAILAHHLCKFSHIKRVEFVKNDENPLKPYLRVFPGDKLENKIIVIIIPFISQNFWKLERCGLNMSNLRLSWYLGLPKTDEKEAHFPTPNYNHSILFDMLLPSFDQEIAKIFLESRHFKEAAVILQIWLLAKNLHNAVSSLFVHCFICFLMKNKRITSNSSVFHIFRTFLLVFSQTFWDKKGASLIESCDLDEFHKHFPIVFIDFSGFFNICHDWSVLTYYRLKNECALSLQILDSADSDTFAYMFTESVPFYRKYDQFFTLDLSETTSFECPKEILADFSGRKNEFLLRKIIDLLQKSIGSRIFLMEYEKNRLISWAPDENPVDSGSIYKFGLLLNPDTYANLLDKGPAADSSEAFEFRDFWREKSEMRKFADTSICEAVVWDPKKGSIIEQIVKHILHRHMQISGNKIKFYGSQINQILKSKLLKSTGDEEISESVKSYEEFSQILRLIEGLPLKIGRVFSCSTFLRRTEVFPALALPPAIEKSKHYVRGKWLIPRPGSLFTPSWCPSMEVQITLESSGKWPDDLNAIRKLKTAFYIQISRLLESQFQILSTVFEDSVLVFYKNFVFRLIIVYPREIHLLKTTKNENGVIEMKNNEEAARLEKDIQDRPKLSGYLNSIVKKYPSYSSSCRCVKRWISCHMISDYLCDELIELIVAHVYLSPHPYSIPGSCYAAFLRVLNLLANFDWLISPLIVNLNNEIDKEKLREIKAQFLTLRPTLPPMCVITPEDHTGTKWTRPYPNAMIVERLTQLAHSSLQYIKKNMFDQNLFDLMVIFRTPLDPYDVLIWLNERHVPKRFMTLDKSYQIEENWSKNEKLLKKISSKNQKSPKRLINEPQKCMPVVDFDPVTCFLQDLKENFGKILMPFYDKCGGNVIGLLFKPGSKRETLENKENFVKSLEKLGKGLIKNIECKS